MPSATTSSANLLGAAERVRPITSAAVGRQGWRLTRRRLRAALGVLWIAAGALQLQPFMFSKGLALDVVAPQAAAGQPPFVAGPVRVFVQVVSTHPAIFNWLFAPLELAVGVGLVSLARPRAARWVSGIAVALALGIWWLGEGMGGVLSGATAASMGAPGAALLYAVLGVAAWPTTSGADRPARWLRGAWLAVWGCCAALSALPAQASPYGLADQLAMGSMMSPGILARPELALAERVSQLSTLAAAGIACGVVAVQAVIAVGGLANGRTRNVAVVFAMAFAIATWVLCQGFGGITTGEATDVATAPLLALFTVALLSTEQRPLARGQVISSSFSRTA